MAEATTYNGWTNYETWNAALWMDNDQGSYEQAREDAKESLEQEDGDRDAAVNSLRQTLKDRFEEDAPDLGASCYADLLGAAMGEINWYEIAENIIDEVYAELDADEE